MVVLGTKVTCPRCKNYNYRVTDPMFENYINHKWWCSFLVSFTGTEYFIIEEEEDDCNSPDSLSLRK